MIDRSAPKAQKTDKQVDMFVHVRRFRKLCSIFLSFCSLHTTAPADEDMTDSGRHIPGSGWKIGRTETPTEGEVEHSMTFTVWGKQCKKQTRYEYTVLHSK